MPKYVCDVEQVFSIGEKVCQLATDMGNSITTYSSRIDSDLSGWSGKAKTAFQSTNQEQVQIANEDVKYMSELGEFIKEAAKKIQENEEQLASVSI